MAHPAELCWEMRGNPEREWRGLGFLHPRAGASLLGMGRAVACLSLLIISSLLAVGAEPPRHRHLKEIGHREGVSKHSDIRYLLPFLLYPLSF